MEEMPQMPLKPNVLFKHSLRIHILIFVFLLGVFGVSLPGFIKSLFSPYVSSSSIGITGITLSSIALIFAIAGNIYLRKRSGIIKIYKIFEKAILEFELDFKKTKIDIADITSVKIEIEYNRHRNNNPNYKEGNYKPSGRGSLLKGANKKTRLIFAVRSEAGETYDFIINTKITPKITERFIDTMKQFDIEVG